MVFPAGTLVMLLILSFLFGGASAASPETPDTEAAVQPVNGFVDALSRADVDALAGVFHDDATIFMPFPAIPQRLDGKAAIRAAFAPMFESMRTSGRTPPYMRLNPVDLQVQSYGDTAVVTFHLGSLPSATATEPSPFSRRTFVVTKKNGRWLISHLHASNMALQPAGGK